MSSASVSSSKRGEKETSELVQELESVRSLNNGLRTYLDHIRNFKKNLKDVDDNCKQLNKVNAQCVQAIALNKKMGK